MVHSGPQLSQQYLEINHFGWVLIELNFITTVMPTIVVYSRLDIGRDKCEEENIYYFIAAPASSGSKRP